MNRFFRYLLLGAGLLAAAQASAVGTRRFSLDKAADFKGGDLKGVAVDSAGHVRAGFNLGFVPVSPGTAIWAALQHLPLSAVWILLTCPLPCLLW